VAALPLRELRVLLEDSIGTAYEVARGLCPLDIRADSLGLALERLAKRVGDTNEFECEYREQGDASVNAPQTALHLYRIAQEAVANATRHARPRRIAITLRGVSESLILEIEDDGGGLGPNQGTTGGMGLNIMAYRASILGGTLAVEQAPGGGTRVVCRVPRGSCGDGSHRRGDGCRPEPSPWSDSQEDARHAR
jgi:signal transduction histidine kinase